MPAPFSFGGRRVQFYAPLSFSAGISESTRSPLPGGDCPSEIRRERGASPRGCLRHRRESRPGISQNERWLERRCRAVARFDRRRNPPSASDPRRRRWLCPLDRLRQCGEYAARSLHGPPPGNRHPVGNGRQPRQADQPTSNRKLFAQHRGRRAGIIVCLRGNQGLDRGESGNHSSRAIHSHGPERSRFYISAFDRHRTRVRTFSSIRHHAHQFAGCACAKAAARERE